MGLFERVLAATPGPVKETFDASYKHPGYDWVGRGLQRHAVCRECAAMVDGTRVHTAHHRDVAFVLWVLESWMLAHGRRHNELSRVGADETQAFAFLYDQDA